MDGLTSQNVMPVDGEGLHISICDPNLSVSELI